MLQQEDLWRLHKKSTKRGLGEISGFTGFKPVDVDIEKSFLFKSLDLKQKKVALTGRYNRIRLNKESTEEEIRSTYDDVNKEYGDLIKEATDLVQSAIRLGVDTSAIVKTLKSQNFSQRDISFMLSNRDDYTFIPSRIRQ